MLPKLPISAVQLHWEVGRKANCQECLVISHEIDSLTCFLSKNERSFWIFVSLNLLIFPALMKSGHASATDRKKEIVEFQALHTDGNAPSHVPSEKILCTL